MSISGTGRIRPTGWLPVLIAVGLGPAAMAQDNAELILPPSADDGDAETQPDQAAPDTADRPAAAQAAAGPTTAEPAPSPADTDNAANDASADDRSAVAARLSENDPDRSVPIEEVLVIGEQEWRLPDLGSEWRRIQETEDDGGRIELSLVPLYDPENRDPVADLFERNSELHRVGMIELIRLRFGGRPQD